MLKSPNLATDVSEPPESDTHTEDGNLSVGSHTGNSQKPSYAAMARTSRPRPHSPALADFVAPVVSGTTQRKAPLSGGGGAHVSRHVGVRNDSSAVENSAWGPTHGRNANSLNPSRSNSPNSSANVSSINSAVASSPDLKVFSMNSATDFPPPLPLLAMVGSSPVKNSLSDVYMKEKISNPSPVGPVDPLETAEGVFTAPVQIISRLPPSGKTYATAATEKRPTAVVKPMTFEREPNPPVSPPKHGLINNLVVVATADVQVGGNGSGGGDESFHSTALNLSSQFNRVELGSVIYNNAKTTRGMSAEPFNNPNSTRSNKGKAVIPASGGNGGRPRAASMDNQSGAGVITAGGKPGKTTDVTSVKPPLNLAPMQSETNFSVSIPDGTGLAPPVTQRDNNSAAFLGIQGVPVVSCTRESGVNDAAKGPPAPTSTNPPERKPVPNAVETEPKRERKAASVSGATTKAVEFLNEPAGAYPAKTAAFEGLTFGFDLDEGSPSRDKKSAETERSAESSQTSPSQSATLSSENCSNVTAAGRGAATECGSDHPRCDPAVLVCGSAMPKSQWDRTTATQEVRGAVVKSRSFAGHDSNAVARENNEVMLKSMVKFVEQGEIFNDIPAFYCFLIK